MRTADLAVEHLKVAAKPELLDLVDQELLDRLLQAVLHLTDTGSASGKAVSSEDQLLGEEMGLAASSSAVSALVALRRKQRQKATWYLSS